MFSPRLWTRSARRLLVLLLAVVVPPAVTLVWLGLALFERDRQDRRDAAVETAVNSLKLSLNEAERRIGSPAADALARFTISDDGIESDDPDHLVWSAVPVPGLAAGDEPFLPAEVREHGGNAVDALRQYAGIAASPDTALRTAAQFRIARVHRAAKDWSAALATYQEVADTEGIAIDGAPADLQARRAMADILLETGRTRELADLSAALEADLISGRWTRRIDRALWEVAVADVERWSGRPIVLPEREHLSAAADALWADVQRRGGRSHLLSGWRVIVAGTTSVTLFIDGPGARAVAVPAAEVATWLHRAAGISGTTIAIAAANGTGSRVPAPTDEVPTVVRIGAEQSGLPWTLAVTVGESPASLATLAARRRLLAVGMIAILLLLGGTSYVLWRLMSRELAVARLQTEFVSAVSHEFRTPLTSIKHVTELLDENDRLAPEERKAFYGALARNTDRLQRFVESLLDFSRLEAGRRSYEPVPMEAGEFVAEVVADFQRDAAPRPTDVRLERDPGTLPIAADRASLANALWNLLDNAVKYSPSASRVVVSVRAQGEDVAIAVRDEGVGIPAGEQREIFRRFVRGRTATRLGIRGTGLGLAIVTHIVSAHRGTVRVESAEGTGSTFTLLLPRASQAAGPASDHRASLMTANG